MRIVLDTNVLVSEIVYESPAMAQLLAHATFVGDVYLADYVKDELIDVVVRKFPHKVRQLLTFLDKAQYATLPNAPEDAALPETQLTDAKDLPILRLAHFHKIDVLVTGDKHFRRIELPGLQIMTPAEFIAAFGLADDTST